MLPIAPPVAKLRRARAEASQVFAKGVANQSGTVHSRPLSGSVRRAKQLRIQHHLNGFHTVDDTPQWNQQSSGAEAGREPPRRPEIYEAPEERGVKYAIRIPANESLEREIAELLPRLVGRPSQKPLVEYKRFPYRAASEPGETANRALRSHRAEKCQRRRGLGRAKAAPRLRRTAKWSRPTTPKTPGRLAVDTTGQEG